MSFILGDDSSITPLKLSLSKLPRHKPPPEPLVTPPFQPMVSVPFQWEDAPGRPKPTNSSSLFKPKSVRSLKLPPVMAPETEVPPSSMSSSSSPTTVLDGPFMGRSMSLGPIFANPGPIIATVTGDLGLDGDETSGGLDPGKSENDLSAHFEACRCEGPGCNPKIGKKGNLGILPWDGGVGDVDVQVKITRFRRSRGSLYELTRKSSLLLGGIYGSLKQMVARKSTKKRDKM